MIEFWAALSIVLLGSLHCVGMCGPIALALPLNRTNSATILSGNFFYHLGRLLTYLSLGVIFGFLGLGLIIIGIQQSLSIAVGLIMIISVLKPYVNSKALNFSSYNLWLGRVKGAMGKKFKRTSNKNLFVIGALNGLLPCGLVYMAITGSVAMANPVYSGLFMLAFGVGTMPLMLSVGVYGHQVQKKFTSSLKRFIPVFIILIGTIFILRGMDLGIPYLSPELSSNYEVVKCH